jgi:hypothetical protein
MRKKGRGGKKKRQKNKEVKWKRVFQDYRSERKQKMK